VENRCCAHARAAQVAAHVELPRSGPLWSALRRGEASWPATCAHSATLHAFVEQMLAPRAADRPTAAAALEAAPLRDLVAARAPIALNETVQRDALAAAALVQRIDAIAEYNSERRSSRVSSVSYASATDSTPVVRSRVSLGTPLPGLSAARLSLDAPVDNAKAERFSAPNVAFSRFPLEDDVVPRNLLSELVD
jgi:hypothetical protein